MLRFCWIKTRRQANLGLGEETQGSELFWSPEAVLESLSGKKKRDCLSIPLLCDRMTFQNGAVLPSLSILTVSICVV